MRLVEHDGSGVTLDNWQVAPQLSWSFQNVATLFPTAAISRGVGPVAPLELAPQPVGEISYADLHGTPTTIDATIAATETDGWIVWRDGVVLAEEYPGGMSAGTPHLLMSVSKSLVGSVAGALIDRGALHPDQLVTDVVPELIVSGYAGGATVRHLLDMRSGISFSEDYLDPDSEVRLLEQAIGWASPVTPGIPDTMRGFLTTLRPQSEHGGRFNYRSGETDVLGWVCEAAGGARMGELMSSLLWSRLGCEFDANIGIDRAGTGMFDGGISAALRDLVRFGVMLLHGGVSLTGERVLSPAWIDDTWTGGPDSRDAFASSDSAGLMSGGMYRNQFWFPYADRPVLLALGIHGQMIYVNPLTRVVAAKLSSWPSPQDAWKLYSTLRAFDAIA